MLVLDYKKCENACTCFQNLIYNTNGVLILLNQVYGLHEVEGLGDKSEKKETGERKRRRSGAWMRDRKRERERERERVRVRVRERERERVGVGVGVRVSEWVSERESERKSE